LQRQYEIVSFFLSSLYKTYAPIVQQNVLFVYDWLRVSLPKAYNQIVESFLILKKTIYDLNPAMFDKAGVVVNDALDYVIKIVPEILDRCVATLNFMLESIRGYFVQRNGQQQFRRYAKYIVLLFFFRELGI